jgi:choline/glycine/proline betaine transport protein
MAPCFSPSSQSSLIRHLGLEIHSRVFFASAGIIILFVVLSLMHLAHISTLFEAIEEFIAQKAGWFYILSVNLFLGFVVFLLFSRYGSLRLGGSDATPDFTYWGWYAMLFSAGMGIGLLFWSVAEPLAHFRAPPYGQGKTIGAAKLSMSITFLHWGLHTWAIYALAGLGLAFFSYNHRLPLSLRSVFHPLLGERIHGPIGDLIDVTATVSTLFGVATSLGLGAQQINAGLAHVFGIAHSTFIQLLIIAAITAVATVSVVLGLARGIQRLSQVNMGLALSLLLVLFILGPTLFILEGFIQNVGHYLRNLIQLSTWTEAYRPTDWQHEWTIFYWGWWIAWSPFVGMFIARISRGRTVREFLTSVVLVPTMVTVTWLTVFGNSALFVELHGPGGLSQAVKGNVSVALFVLLEQFPLSFLTSLLGIFVVMIFFVTSSDSASFVIDMITAGGRTHPPVKQRVFWAITEGVVAGVLLLGGGLVALRIASVSTGLPFALILLFACVSLWKGLQKERFIASSDVPSW